MYNSGMQHIKDNGLTKFGQAFKAKLPTIQSNTDECEKHVWARLFKTNDIVSNET